MSDVDADERDKYFLACWVTSTDSSSRGGDDQLADGHSECTVDHGLATTEFVNGPDTGDSHADVNDVGSDGAVNRVAQIREGYNVSVAHRNLHQERIGDTRATEERRTVVEDEVDSRKLLQRLQADTGPDTEGQAGRTGSPQQLGVTDVGLSLKTALVVNVRGNVGQLIGDVR